MNTSKAPQHLAALATNVYPGRGLIEGLSDDEKHLIQISWIMGRSENSRNRIYVKEAGGLIRTAFANPSLGCDPSLVIYNTMKEDVVAGKYVVSNGHQTDTVLDSIVYGKETQTQNFEAGLAQWQYEPDKSNFTPRITGSFWIGAGWRADMSLIRRGEDFSCERHHFFTVDLDVGFGFCLHTYKGDGDPLPSFEGEPFTVPLRGNAEQILDTYRHTLNPTNLVSLAVKFISADTGHSKVLIYNSHQ